MNDSVYRTAGLPRALRKVYLLLRIGLPDALLPRAEPALLPCQGTKRLKRPATQANRSGWPGRRSLPSKRRFLFGF